MSKINLYNGDCLNTMKSFDDEIIDIIITSPPYNLGNNHHTGNKFHKPYNDNLPEDKYQEWQIEVLNECYRLLKPNGSMFYNHKNRIKKGRQITPYEWLLKTNFVIKQEIVWINGSQNFDKIRFYPMTERVYWLTKSPNTKLMNTINHNDVFQRKEWNPRGIKGEHTRCFPEKMVEDILMCFPESKTVLDPFMGIGTTGIVCKRMNKEFTGIEIDKKYYEIAMK